MVLGGGRIRNSSICITKTTRDVSRTKEANHRLTSCPQALPSNHTNKIPNSQLYTVIESFTRLSKGSQKVKLEILIRPTIALRNPMICLLTRTLPYSQQHRLPNSKDITLLQPSSPYYQSISSSMRFHPNNPCQR